MDPINSEDSARANRKWWDQDAISYHSAHPEYLTSFYWCPEMLHESQAHLLGDVSSQRVLEIGCGSAPCATWLSQNYDADIYACDISRSMMDLAPESTVHLIQADAHNLPFASQSFDTIFSVFGAIPFVADTAQLMRDIYGLLVPGGRFVMSVTHPMRWIFPDDPTEAGLYVTTSYFDRTPYSEQDPFTEEYTYVEHHRTMGDRIRELIQAGFILDDLIEPEWPQDLQITWGQWSPLRGKFFPGTAIFVAHKPQN